MLKGAVIAFEKYELGLSLMVEDGDNFQTLDIPLNMVSVAFEVDENGVEDTLSSKIPFNVEIRTRNGVVSPFALA